MNAAYCELEVTSCFSFLRGASHPEEYVRHAQALGHQAIAITDENTVAGIPRAHVAAQEVGIRLVCGAAAVLSDTPAVPKILLFAANLAGWRHLCRLITIGRRRATKGDCTLWLQDVLSHAGGLLAVAIPEQYDDASMLVIERLAVTFDDDRLSIAIRRHLDGRDQVAAAMSLSRRCSIPLVATNDVRFHVARRRSLHDVMTCVDRQCTLEDAGMALLSNSERHLRSASDMAARFSECPEAIDRAVGIAARASTFSLNSLQFVPPSDVCPDGMSADARLRELVREGSADRYPSGVPTEVRSQIEHELDLIQELQYASYFLTVEDIVRFARQRRILCQGRGAAANSAVCYVLGLTAVDPSRSSMLFERFVSRHRNEPPDIDIDFEHERREEVIQYIYRRYGRERAALCAAVTCWRWRSAIREVGKVLDLSLDVIDQLAREGRPKVHQEASGSTRVQLAIRVAEELIGFPRHLSQHVGGFVMTQGALCDLVPIQNAAMEDRTVIEWDKDDLDAMGILKVDVLGLGMLTCLRRCLDEVNAWEGSAASMPPRTTLQRRAVLELGTIEPEDPAVYDMCCRADTIGVFQIESRAQMAMLPRLQPRCFYDLVVEIALVRPGPIQGGMVHPYLRRREGREAITYPSDEVRVVLERTLGVPVFQEQAMRLAMVAGGFTADEAEELRRAMGAWKRCPDRMGEIGSRLVQQMRERGYAEDFIERCWKQIHGFSEYGFPESHAASFALLVYASAWLKCHHPAAFACSLLNSQPMGFYAPAQIIRDAIDHGVEIRPVDVNHSRWGCALEQGSGGAALRLGLRMVNRLKKDDAVAVQTAAARCGGIETLYALHHVDGVSAGGLRALASADAFQSIGLNRQEALWNIRRIIRGRLSLFDAIETGSKQIDERVDESDLPEIPLSEMVLADYGAIGASLRGHPVACARTWLETRSAVTAASLKQCASDEVVHGQRCCVGGLVIVRQRPGSAKGIVFLTLEDETGSVNIVVGHHVYRQCRSAVRMEPAVFVRGTVQRHGQVLHIKADHVEPMPSIDQARSAYAGSIRSFR